MRSLRNLLVPDSESSLVTWFQDFHLFGLQTNYAGIPVGIY